MAQYNSLNIKLLTLQLNKLKSAIKNETEILRSSSYMIGNSDDINFPHKLLLTNRQVANLCKAFAKNPSANIRLSETQLSKIVQSGGFLGKPLGPLLKTGLPLMKNVIKCFNFIRINSSSISRCRNTYKNLRLWNNNTNNIK